MIAKIHSENPCGEIEILPSKSIAHRLLICAALSDSETEIFCPASSADIAATVRCLNSLGAEIGESDGVYRVTPIKPRESADLFCGESGSTLRFLIPLASVLGGRIRFTGEGRLPERTCAPLAESLKARGAKIEYSGILPLETFGGLSAGRFSIPGNISSQFISGLIFALPLLSGDSEIDITGKIESLSYINLTVQAVRQFGITISFDGNKIKIPGNQKYISPGSLTVEGDWSNAAFWLCLGALSEEGVKIKGLNTESLQGDREIINILSRFGADILRGDGFISVRKKNLTAIRLDASEIPDLIPVVSVLAAVANGETHIFNASRLRLKESDRIKSCVAMLKSLGAAAEETRDGMRIFGKKKLSGGSVNSYNDHRIAMSASIAAAACEGDVEIKNAEACAKSYGDFFEKYSSLGAVIEKTEV